MQNFVEIHQRNPELLSSGAFRPPPRLDRGIERPRLDRVKIILYFLLFFVFLSSILFTVIVFQAKSLMNITLLNLV